MKKIQVCALFCASFFICAALYAGPAALDAVEGAQVGVAAAVRGAVKITSQSRGEKTAENGQAIFLGDQVTTEKDGNLQILLLDETTFTVGPNSAVAIDKFVYDPETHDGDVKARVVKGVFRFVTGKIGQKNPEKMEVDLPAGTIGIRGTIVAGEVAGEKSTVVLLGPGENNNTPHRQGKFTLTSESGGKTFQQTVSKSGFGSTIESEGAPPSKPFQVPAEMLNKITGSLNIAPPQQEQSQAAGGGGGQTEPSKGGELGKGESPTQQSGQGKAEAKVSVKDARMMNRLFQKLGMESNDASQQAIDNVGTIVLDGPTSRDQLQQAAQKFAGVNHYIKTGVPASGLTGNVDFDIEINFGGRYVGGGSSKVAGDFASSGKFLYDLGSQTISFGSGSDNARFVFLNVNNTAVPPQCANCTFGDIDVGVDNKAGQVAAEAHLSVKAHSSNSPGGGTTVATANTVAQRS